MKWVASTITRLSIRKQSNKKVGATPVFEIFEAGGIRGTTTRTR